MSTKSISSTTSSTKAPAVKPSAPPVSRVPTNLSRSNASSSQSLHSSTSETQSQSTVRTAPSIRRSQSSNEILTENIDDFALQDRVWVNGQRPGLIKYLGDTQFAPGKWAGIELESEEGKNDGSVAGIRYFECKPKFGVFVRPQRLTRQQIEEQKSSNKSSPTRESLSPSTPNGADKQNLSIGSNKTNGNTSGSTNTNGSHYSLSAGRYEQKFSVGDRVLVNATTGTKLGTLMFLGTADFAPGRWAGIELDEALGKNDGSVAGRRYFKCEMKYGLFAPIHKITAAPLSALGKQKKSKSSRPSTAGSLSRQRSAGSQESLNSIASSTASSTRPPRVRLGVTSLSSAQKGSKNSVAAQVTAHSTVLNDVIKEKEDHISQLLKERDLERGEVARAAAQADTLEERLAALQSEHQKLVQEADEEIQELKRLNQEYEEIQLKVNTQLEDEKKKIEDLQFRLEEETIIRSDLESTTSALKVEIENLKKEIKSSAELRTKSDSEQVSTLEEKLRELDNKRESDVFALQEDLLRKEEAVFQLEASVEKRNTELVNCQKRLLELEQELESTKQRTDRQIESIDEMNLKIKREESLKQEFLEENKRLRQQLTESEKRLQNLEHKLSDITSGKSLLEKELDSKDSVERQLEDKLMETKVKYEKFEAEVHSLESELTEIKANCDQEVKKRQESEYKIQELSALNRNLELKVEDLMRTSGTNSDLLLRMNTEVMDKQKEFQKKERHLKDEIENYRKENDTKSEEIRVLSIELEDKKSLITRFEKKQLEFDKNIQILENELKLTRSDCDEKQGLVQELRQQLNDLKLKLNNVSKDQALSKGDFEYKLKDMQKELQLKEQELESTKKEWRDLRDNKFELELERDRYRRDSERLEKTCEERLQTIESLRQDVKQMKDEFEKYRNNLEKELQSTHDTKQVLHDLGSDLDRQKKATQEVEDENQSLKDDNRHMREKIEELRDDIEALDKRHREVLTEFEYECERLQARAVTAEQLAEDKQHRLLELEEQQSMAFEQFRRQAEIEKRQLEQTLNELEVKVRESINANSMRREQEVRAVSAGEGTDNYEQQIEFLNSVIVDMQKKNDELRNRVQVLEEIGLDEFDSSLNRVRVNGHIRAPRMFCDICDVFDSHETEDCPQQCNQEQEVRNHTYYHSIRSDERPYCLQCERFGHNTEHCPEAETF